MNRALKKWGAVAVWLVGALALVGCQTGGKRVGAVSIANHTLGPMTIAVAPALNVSGSRDFDPNRLADLMASELSFAEGISVIPVSRVLAVLAAQGFDEVQSASHALELAKLVGADAILVTSVTEYDPYDPPSVGLTAQLLGHRPGAGFTGLDPTALSRRATLAGSLVGGGSDELLLQTQRVYNASHGSVVDDIKIFAALRDGSNSPFGWRKFVVSQQHFIRYCCYATIRNLLNGQYQSGFGSGDPKG